MLLFLELNEINFDDLRHYADKALLPNFSKLISAHSVVETTSEAEYQELEPWIQWVTAHTGLSLSDHGVFRLGDILDHDIPQIWEHLESKGLKVGAISPMNAKNRTKDAAFFVPDPWTPAKLTASPLLKALYDGISQAVNDNAQAKVSKQSLLALLSGAARYAKPSNYRKYVSLASNVKSKPWSKALFLDQLLTDVFITETKAKRPDFGSLFLNAGAHIQHHYMFNSPAYTGSLRNPEWLLKAEQDPVLEVYQLYDRIIGQIQKAFPTARLMLATGLHQDPHPELTFYWRLKDHGTYLNKIGVPFETVEPRMSRDFLINCKDENEAREAERLLKSATSESGEALYEVDNRGKDLFVMLTWPHDVPQDFIYQIGNQHYEGLRDDIAFVAIKNGQHNGIGYFLDTGAPKAEEGVQFPLKELPRRVCAALNVEWEQPVLEAAE